MNTLGYFFIPLPICLGMTYLSAEPLKSPVDSYKSDCNNYLTIKGLEKTLICDNYIGLEKQESKMGETLVKDGAKAAKPEARKELFSDKFKGGTQIHEIFAYNLAKATDDMLNARKDLSVNERDELRDALRSHAEYEIEDDGHALIGAENGVVISKVIEKFGLEKAKPMVMGVLDKRMNDPRGESLALKKHGVFDEYQKIVRESGVKAMDEFSKEKTNPEVALNDKKTGVPANQVNATTVSAKEAVTAK